LRSLRWKYWKPQTPETERRLQQALAAIACGLLDQGVGQLVVAGGETSGAVVQALGIEQLAVGPQIDPGVPWMVARSQARQTPLAIALKSGNFGSIDFFAKALAMLPQAAS
jgi:uncharacterized protein YgbK (DUF1537 family)